MDKVGDSVKPTLKDLCDGARKVGKVLDSKGANVLRAYWATPSQTTVTPSSLQKYDGSASDINTTIFLPRMAIRRAIHALTITTPSSIRNRRNTFRLREDARCSTYDSDQSSW